MSAADSPTALRTFGTTQKIVNAEGRRGSFAPVVVSREVAYCVAVLDGPADHEPTPLTIEALVDGVWTPLQWLSTDASLSDPEVQVTRWDAPHQAQAFRPATGWHSGATIPTPVPAAARPLTGGDVDGFWEPAIARGDVLACIFVSYASEPWKSPLPQAPALEGRFGEQWQPLSFIEGGAGIADDGVLIQHGRWSIDEDVSDVRISEAVSV
ncbi:hypothetical protein [Kineococcus rubinsiae]|uniref:hypothetical protein n=1 Tax=Kineococcus rubinsiae TaxID=2609562 RepID=UPI00143211D0|nr:hypothetical protein [Kineococcus rubinsiae]NIZ90402.1 hypothetical protein [Kineococcus rubinsiae]